MAIDSTNFCSSCLICAKLVAHPKVRLKLNNCNLPTRPATLLPKRKPQIKKTAIPAPVSKKQILTFAKCVSKFFELFNSPPAPDNTFEKDFNEFFKFTPLSSRCPVCEDCQNRIRLISKVMTHIESLQLQLIKLKQSVENDLSEQINSTSRSSNSNSLNNKMKFIIGSGVKARLFREKLRKKLQTPLTGGKANEADAVDSTVVHEINSCNRSIDPILFDRADIEAQFALNDDDDLNLYSDDFDVKPFLDHEGSEDNIAENFLDIRPEWGYETKLTDDTENGFRDNIDSTNTHIYASVEIEGTTRTLTLSNLKEPVIIDTSLKEEGSDEMRVSIQDSLISETEPEAQTCFPAKKSYTKFAKKRKQPRAQHKDMKKCKGGRNVIKCTIVNLVKDGSLGKVLDQFILDAHLNQPHEILHPALLNDANGVEVHAEDMHSEPILFPEAESQCELATEDLDYNFDNEYLDAAPDSDPGPDLEEINISDVNSGVEIQPEQGDTSQIDAHMESEGNGIANTDRFTIVEIEGATSTHSSNNLEGNIFMESALQLQGLDDFQVSDELNSMCEAEPNPKHTESTSTISVKKTRRPKYYRSDRVPKVRLLQCTFVDPVKGECKVRLMNQDRLDAHINRCHKTELHDPMNETSASDIDKHVEAQADPLVSTNIPRTFWNSKAWRQRLKRLPFKCTFVDPVKGECNKRVTDQNRLDAHFKRFHKTPRLETEKTDSTCVKIPKSAKYDPFSVPTGRPLQCPFVDPVKGQCKIRVTDQDRLDTHVNRFHTNNPIQDPKKKRRQLKCTFVDPIKGQCNIRLMNQDKLVAHLNRFHKKPNARCDQKTGRPRVKDDPSRDPMERRKQLKCTFVDPVKGECNIRVMDQDRLDSHINRWHKNIPVSESFKCNLCPFAAGKMKQLRYHRKIHAGIKDATCEICGMSFRSEENLVCHKRRKHGEPFPVQCDICKQGFNNSHALKLHNYKNHGDGNYTHRCSVCDAGFYVKLHLDIHMVKHAEPTFRCDECSKTFKTKGALKNHKVLHTGIRPFVCDVCNWRFYTQQKLDSHRSVHTNKRPFLCQECGFSCRLKKLLHSHLKVHENNKKLAEQGIKKQPRLAKPRNRRLKVYVPSPSFPIPLLTLTSTETEKQQVESESAKD